MKKLTTLLLVVAGLLFTTKLFGQTVDSVFYYLDVIDSANVSVITDNIEATPLTMHGDLTIWDYSSGSLAQNKMRINKGLIAWAADGPEQGPQAENFAQIVVSPKPGFDFHVDSVGAWIACYGTHYYMHCAVYWGTDTNSFTMTPQNELLYDSATYGDIHGLPDVSDEENGPLHDTVLAVDTNIPDGGSFVLRFFPWFNDSSPSQTKWLVLWNLRVYGTAGPGTDVNDVNSLPKEYALNQNYPNPFNPSTKISFDLKKSGYTVLTVHNILGQKVATVLSKEMSAGHHEVNFNALNLSSGVYFYKLESGNFTSVKKMMLLQ
jgi:hypothetical protein